MPEQVLIEIIDNAIIVTKYGSIFRNCDGKGQPLACPTNCNIVIPPKISAPKSNLKGSQEAKTTSARAIQPFPSCHSL